MRKFKVITLAVGGNNKVHRLHDVVTEKDFPTQNVGELVEKGYLKEIGGSKEPEAVEVEDNEKSFDDWTVKAIKTELKANDVDFSGVTSKKDLYDLMVGSVK